MVEERSDDTTGIDATLDRILEGCQSLSISYPPALNLHSKAFIMGSTFHSIHFHAVFSTKFRAPIIAPEWGSRLHKYIAGTILGLNGIPLNIGGVTDHVHLLFSLKPVHCLADVMREIKKSSSAWMHDEMKQVSFAWQEGYSVFSVSPTARESVGNYIENQEEHHRRKTFHEELKELLILAGIEFEEKYLD